MTSKPSFGITFHPTYPPQTLVSFARRAEAAGFDEVLLWEDCFYAGALTSAATMLAATEKIKVGVGLLPAVARSPLFAAMEITTLACLYPGRFIPGFGHGVERWMKQIGAYPKSTLRALEETVLAVRGLLRGENTTLQGEHVHFDHVKMELTPAVIPPLLVGGIREKTLQLAGRVGDGAIFTSLSSPAYVRWAMQYIARGMAEAGRVEHQRVVQVMTKVGPDGTAAREAVRRELVKFVAGGEPHLFALGIAEEAPRLVEKYGPETAAKKLPEAWVNELTASGTPDQAARTVQNLIEAGADTVVFEPVDGDPANLQDCIDYLLPALRG